MDYLNSTPLYKEHRRWLLRKRGSLRDRETSDEAGVCETSVQLSDIPKPCEDLSQIFPNGITTFFRITMRVPCTCLFSRTCSNSLLTSWFDIICIEAIVCYNPEPFSSHPLYIISFASQFWAVKNIYYPFCFGDKPRYKPIDLKNNELPYLELR